MADRKCDGVASWLSGMSGLIVGAPFDAVKTKQQHLDIGFYDGARTLKRLEGYTAFFRGQSLPVVVNGVLNVLFFYSYDKTLKFIGEIRGKSKISSSKTNQGGIHDTNDSEFMSKTVVHNLVKIAEDRQSEKLKSNPIDVITAGLVAGLIQLSIACPVEVIKVRQQTYGDLVGNPISCIKHIYISKGTKGFYAGLYPMAIRNIAGGLVQSVVYRFFCDGILKKEKQPMKLVELWLAAGFAGTVSWMVVCPLDVIKTKLQADQYMSPKYPRGTIVNCAKSIVRSQGLFGLFRGMLSLSIPNFFTNAIVFGMYNTIYAFCFKSKIH